jgi:hypothetical protein
MTRYMMIAVVTVCAVLAPRLAPQAGATSAPATLRSGERTSKPRSASERSPRPPSALAAKLVNQAITSTTISEILGQNFSVDPGKSIRLFAKSDFTGAERASIAIYADPSVNIVKTRISVWWGVPNAQTYAVQDILSGSNYPYLNTGGGNVPVYGTSLFVDVNNDSDSSVTIQQLTVYAVAH